MAMTIEEINAETEEIERGLPAMLARLIVFDSITEPTKKDLKELEEFVEYIHSTKERALVLKAELAKLTGD